jgi:hypothetical protein
MRGAGYTPQQDQPRVIGPRAALREAIMIPVSSTFSGRTTARPGSSSGTWSVMRGILHHRCSKVSLVSARYSAVTFGVDTQTVAGTDPGYAFLLPTHTPSSDKSLKMVNGDFVACFAKR